MIEVTKSECKLVINMISDAVSFLASKGDVDMEWICELTELYKKFKTELDEEKPRKIAFSNEAEELAIKRKILLECKECADYNHSCLGADVDICKYNSELAIMQKG